MTRTPSPLRQAALLLLLYGTLALLILGSRHYHGWAHRGIIAPSGGRYFFQRVEIPVPTFRQGDERWRHDLLGPTPGTLGAEGCAVSSAAMVLASYGYDTDPQRLNAFLKTNEGYTPQGWLYWEKAAEIAAGRVRHAYEDLPSYDLIDSNLQRGNPVIVRLRLPSRITHFVVIAGKQGFDYLIRDPGAGASKGLYPLREFGSPIEALRFYERVP
jgi:Peptidase_C39 like family